MITITPPGPVDGDTAKRFEDAEAMFRQALVDTGNEPPTEGLRGSREGAYVNLSGFLLSLYRVDEATVLLEVAVE